MSNLPQILDNSNQTGIDIETWHFYDFWCLKVVDMSAGVPSPSHMYHIFKFSELKISLPT